MDYNFSVASGGVAALAAIAAASIWMARKRRSPKEKERRRREMVNAHGRVIEGYVTSCENGWIEYSYQWRAVRYEASQDLSDLEQAAACLHHFVGPVTVKFLGSRPSNSIVCAENWNGVQGLQPARTVAGLTSRPSPIQ